MNIDSYPCALVGSENIMHVFMKKMLTICNELK